MFTGLVREKGRVASFDNGRLVVEATVDAAIGDSVSVNGVCLTVVERQDGALAFDVVAETIARTKPFVGEANLEPSLRAGDPMGGHVVQGHVDGIGRVRALGADGRLVVEAPAEILAYVVEKGSIAVDGVSLTVAWVHRDAFEVALVPHTLEVTTLGSLREGDAVNLEVDVLAKYVERLLSPHR
ncbi:MAG TPA: riboflavin synthase [Gaiellaceae bacterium]|nr:riboflavin synthase [Gaiellaceae bacterium]